MYLLSEEMVRYKQKNKRCFIYKLTRGVKCTSTTNKAFTIIFYLQFARYRTLDSQVGILF